MVPKKNSDPTLRRASTMSRTYRRTGPRSRTVRYRSSPSAMPRRRSAASCERFCRASALASLVLAGTGAATRRLATGRFGVASPFFGV